MSDLEEHPELSGYDPGDGRPLRGRRGVVMVRVIVALSVIALVLPGVLTTASLNASNAAAACVTWVRHVAPDAMGSSARFEFFGPGGIGWQCYTVGAFGGDRHVASLGLIPSRFVAPPAIENS
jgi:hypothetical protein